MARPKKMRKSKINRGFDGLSDSDFRTLSQGIYTAMLNNEYFPNPIPDLPSVDVALQNFITALINARTKDSVAIEIKNQAREYLNDLLVQLGASVEAMANNDRVKQGTSGYPFAKDGQSVPMVKPKSINLYNGINAGELTSKVPLVEGAKSYGHQHSTEAPMPETQWTEKVSTSSRYMHTGLVSAQKYWCRVIAYGPFDQFVISDTVSRIAQ